MATDNASSSRHIWKFFRAGGFDQVKIDRGSDIVNLAQLDQKLWVALACPTTGLEFDVRTLQLIDTDHDGRIRAPEILAACRWACANLMHPDDLLKGAASLPLNAIQDPVLLSSAKQILVNLGKPSDTEISVEDVSDTSKIFLATNFNGDGIIPAEAAGEDATKAVVLDIIACLGSELDRSGKPGITHAKLDKFFDEAVAFSDWHKKADASVLPFGDRTAAVAGAVRTVRVKVDDFFARCRLAAFDARACNALNREEKEYLAIAAKDLTITSAEIACLPLARIEAGKSLPLADGINPAWEAALMALQPLFPGQAAITADDWTALTGKLAAFEAWRACQAGGVVEKLGLARVRQILASKGKDTIAGLLAKDQAVEPEANAIANVERLVRYHRDLALLLTNFVNFKDFYARRKPAIFLAGTLYLDQRSCELTLAVEDVCRHATMAGLAGAYLAYCDCVRKTSGEKRQIVAAFTDGDSDNLMVGRNGIFYDRQGRDWDATITKIIDNPISLRQAFWGPYKKFVRMIEEHIARRAAAADTTVTTQLQTTAQGVAVTDPRALAPKKIDTGTLAAIGLVLTTLLAALGGIFGAFARLPVWQIPLALVGIMLAISTPAMILAYIKLRKRNLGPILDANGWAVNAKAKINVPFGAALTGIAKLPEGSHRDLVDPYAENNRGRYRVIALLVLAGVLWAMWYFGCIRHYWPDFPTSSYVERKEARLEKARLQNLESEKHQAAPVPAVVNP